MAVLLTSQAFFTPVLQSLTVLWLTVVWLLADEDVTEVRGPTRASNALVEIADGWRLWFSIGEANSLNDSNIRLATIADAACDSRMACVLICVNSCGVVTGAGAIIKR